MVSQSAFVIARTSIIPITTAAVTSGGNPTYVAAAAALAAMVATGCAYGSNPDCEKEHAVFNNYVDVKHTQMALKKLAKNLVKQETKEKETGKSVQAAVIAKAGYAR